MAHENCACVARFDGICSWILASRLSRRHPALRRLVKVVGPLQTSIPRGYSTNEAILRAVVGQMLSSKAAAAIRSRLIAKYGSAEGVFQWVASGPPPRGPGDGLSRSKRKALRAWWQYCNQGAIDPGVAWSRLSTEDLRAAVSGVYGLGHWSADMLAIFLLGRLDVWPVGDAGLDRARAVVFRRMGDRQFFRLIEGHESLVAVYLWEVLNRDLGHGFGRRTRPQPH